MTPKHPNITVTLTGRDGNAFVLNKAVTLQLRSGNGGLAGFQGSTAQR